MLKTTIARTIPTCSSIGLVALSLAACAADAPPFDELPLRDTLSADPEVIAILPDDARRSLAERLEQARRDTPESEEVRPGERTILAAEVRDADLAREARGDDALVLEAIEPRAGAVVVRALRLDDVSACAELPPLEGTPPGPKTAEAEAAALDGRAGAVLAAIVERAGARQLVRAPGWPVGAAVAGDTVFVNPSWLVALAALDDPRSREAYGAAKGARVRPLSIKGNPYVPYPSLEACTADVAGRCDECLSSGNCQDKPALTDFKNAREECSFLAEDPERPARLCALALLSVALIADCVRRQDPACSIPTGTRSTNVDSASTFLASTACVQALDICLGGSPSPTGTGSGTGSGSGSGGVSVPNVQTSSCQDPFSACSSSCKGLSNSCKSNSCSGTSTGSNCTSCGSSSSSCGSCGSSSSSCGSSGNSCKCETAPAQGLPIGAAAWLLAPLAYVFLRPRRKAS
jgi:hypothetical protein